jgi:hypothetical protein
MSLASLQRFARVVSDHAATKFAASTANIRRPILTPGERPAKQAATLDWTPSRPPTPGLAEILAARARQGSLPSHVAAAMKPRKGSPFSFTPVTAKGERRVLVGLHDHTGRVVRHGLFGHDELADIAGTHDGNEFVGRAMAKMGGAAAGHGIA